MLDRWISRETFSIRLFPIRDYITWPRVGLTTITALGFAAHIFDAAIGAHASGRIPFTDTNASIGAGFGKRELVRSAVPDYITSRLDSNIDDVTVPLRFQILSIEGFAVGFIGSVPEVPTAELDYKVPRGS